MKIICFGDSNTYGFDPRDVFKGRYEEEFRWPDILAAKTGWEIRNEGANGRQVPRNPYLLRLLQTEPADRLLVMLGTNDLLQGASAREAAARMENFLLPLLPHCPNILLVAPPPMQRGAWVTTDALVEESRLLAREYQTVADRLGIPFVDTTRWNIPLAFDGVHFTEAGNQIFAARLLEHIQ